MTDEAYSALVTSYYLGDRRLAIEKLPEIRPEMIADLLTHFDSKKRDLGAGLLLILVDLRLRSDGLQDLLVEAQELLRSLTIQQHRTKDLSLDSRKEIARQLLQARASILLYDKYHVGSEDRVRNSAADILLQASRFYHRSKSLGKALLEGRDHGP